MLKPLPAQVDWQVDGVFKEVETLNPWRIRDEVSTTQALNNAQPVDVDVAAELVEVADVVVVAAPIVVYICILQPPPHLDEESPAQATLQSDAVALAGAPPTSALPQ
jgi:hypothetical protein